MFNNIIFIGGIHGVGKSTVCKEICQELKLQYLSASEVLKWKEINEDEKNKKVKDIGYTQDRLIQGLHALVDEKLTYLLDGHFCLFDGQGDVSRIPYKTFQAINPIITGVITGDTVTIKQRLQERDGKIYDHDKLQSMQIQEVDYARMVAENLGVSFVEVSNSTFEKLTETIKRITNP